MERRCSAPAQGGTGVPQHPAVAQCPPHVRAGQEQHCSTPTAPHQVLHHHLQVSSHGADSERHHSLCDNGRCCTGPDCLHKHQSERCFLYLRGEMELRTQRANDKHNLFTFLATDKKIFYSSKVFFFVSRTCPTQKGRLL